MDSDSEEEVVVCELLDSDSEDEGGRGGQLDDEDPGLGVGITDGGRWQRRPERQQ
jgi:hypothetical protein